MKIKHLVLCLLLVCFSTQIFGQTTVEEYVRKAIEFHDSGDYEKAIDLYEKALKLEPKSTLVNYEISLSYFSNGDYKKAIKYADVVLKQKKDNMLHAYITKGSSLDILGKTTESIKLFETAIKETEGHYLLNYNLAINYFNINELDKAEENCILAIEQKPTHGSSHYMLATIHDMKANKVQTLLASYYFLFLEPNSSRSKFAYEILYKNANGNVQVDESKPNTINVFVSPEGDGDEEFRGIEVMLSLLEASKNLESNEGKTEEEMFVENTKSLFLMLGQRKSEENTGIWWDLYTPFFYDLADSDHIEAFCKVISQSSNKQSSLWLKENKEKVNDFEKWLKNR